MTARFGEDLRASPGMANVVVGWARRRRSARSKRRRARCPASPIGRGPARPRPAAARPNVERLSYAYFAPAGSGRRPRCSAEVVFGGAGRAPWGWQSTAIRRAWAPPRRSSPATAGRSSSSGGRAEGLVAAALGGVGAGYRLIGARLAEPGEEIGGTVEFVPPGAPVPVGPRTRANVTLPPVPGGAGTRDRPGRGLFAPPGSSTGSAVRWGCRPDGDRTTVGISRRAANPPATSGCWADPRRAGSGGATPPARGTGRRAGRRVRRRAERRPARTWPGVGPGPRNEHRGDAAGGCARVWRPDRQRPGGARPGGAWRDRPGAGPQRPKGRPGRRDRRARPPRAPHRACRRTPREPAWAQAADQVERLLAIIETSWPDPATAACARSSRAAGG